MKTSIAFPKVSIGDVISIMWRWVGHQPWFFLSFLLFTAGAVFGVIIPYFYKKLFDTLETQAVSPESVATLTGIITVIIALNLSALFFRRGGQLIINWYEARGMAQLRQKAFDYLMHHSHTFFANSFGGSLVQRVSRFARAFERIIDHLFFDTIPLVVLIIGSITVVWSVEQRLAYVIIGLIVSFLGFNLIFSRWKLKYDVQQAAADSRTTGSLADAISNSNSVSLFAAHSAESQRFKGVTNDQARLNHFVWNLSTIVDATQGLLIMIAEFFIFYYAIRLWGANAITLGTFTLVQVYVIQLGQRLWDFGRIILILHEAFADAKEMVEILKLPHEVKDIPNAKALVVPEGSVTFNGVDFAFNETRYVFKDLSFTVAGGQKIALVGPSGAGKTTLVRLMLRLYDTTAGKICIDEQSIAKVTQDSLHQSISYVPQDPLLFHRSLMENIRYGKPEATDEEVVEAARKAHCHEFIDVLPDKYETYVGERGVKLSGGERQRVAIARAILKNAPILILDEATSSLDSESESLIQDALDVLMREKTVIVVAHRLSTIRKMDRIIVLKDGAIVEDGSHDELLKKDDSLYKHLWQLQAGGFIPEEA